MIRPQFFYSQRRQRELLKQLPVGMNLNGSEDK